MFVKNLPLVPAKSKKNLSIWFLKKGADCHCRTSMKKWDDVIPWKIHIEFFLNIKT
jgi:hypothetical protein